MKPLTVVDDRRPNTTTLLPLADYDLIVVCFSGGKDSLALVLLMLDMGVPKEKIQLWHHEIDGNSERFLDWRCTKAYCRAVAAHLGIRLLFQWKEGGFLREMLRNQSYTAPTTWEAQNGEMCRSGGDRGKLASRLQFPQVSADLSVRWCSAYLKIDVCDKPLSGDPALKDKKILLLSGERREESSARSKYAEMERHRTTTETRRVDRWRAVIDWSESQVWDIIKRYGIVPHPAYRLGFPRVSCQHCIFMDANQAATNRLIDPQGFALVAQHEANSGKTIKRGISMNELADKGIPYNEVAHAAELVALAMGETYDEPVFTTNWIMPAGAFRHGGGPT